MEFAIREVEARGFTLHKYLLGFFLFALISIIVLTEWKW